MGNPLFDVREALRARQMATPAQLAAELQLPTSAVEAMLEHWVRRGLAAPAAAQAGAACGSGGCTTCGACATAAPANVVYVWTGSGDAAVSRSTRAVIPLRPAA